MLNYHIVVTGRVQGVGFRWSTHELALQHGLVGQVKNEWDGSVTIDVQGPAAAVKFKLVPIHMPKSPACRLSHVLSETTGKTLKCGDLVEVARF